MSVLVLHDDDFGAAVAARLRSVRPGTVAHRLGGWPDLESLDELITRYEQILFAWSRPVRRLESAVDSAVLRHGKTLLPVVAEGLTARVGPLLGPRAGATVDCYYRRRAQRMGAHTDLGLVHDHFDDHPAGEPAGYLGATVAVVCGLAGRLLDGDPAEPRVVLVQPHLGEATSSVLLGVHGNARARFPVPSEQRTFARLRGIILDAMEATA
ncbi:hypothetical protein [Amycolatopsis keratiniphila]|uniref:hypothetical protein n=1 Tax=Amycolatopsis keratiniphila TaxID=129921 RepID=UPI00087A92FF|nr:hypothetical protein [Amycolatopsis keratiniphila]OLZ47260.1 hypothetical protein BS330_34920 [Amycolatopsis keratiniphila subsp. nogabecina]SDU38644.1 hypothetical protein SAMN04489733_3637 [Amycolatopsis keratiniphila]